MPARAATGPRKDFWCGSRIHKTFVRVFVPGCQPGGYGQQTFWRLLQRETGFVPAPYIKTSSRRLALGVMHESRDLKRARVFVAPKATLVPV